MSFAQPAFLLLLPLLGVFFFLARRKRTMPRGPWPLALWLRGAIALLLILGLAGLKVPAPPRGVATVFVVDMSASVPADIQEGAKTWVRDALRRLGPDDLAGIVTFGANPRVEVPLGRTREHETWREPPAGQASDMGAALQLAADMLPPADGGPLRRIVVLSDGNENLGDAQRDLLRPKLRDVEVAVLALPARLQDSAITSFAMPPAVREGEPAEMRIALQSPGQQEATLRVVAKGGEFERQLYEQTLQLETGPHEVIVDLGVLPRGGWTFRAELSVQSDSRPENNTSWAYTIVGDAPRVLIIESDASSAIRSALAAAQVRVDSVTPQGAPSQMERLLEYEAVILNNVHADDLGRPRQELLREYVSTYGKGLVVVGGERTFGLGEYAETPLEEALPVTVQPPEKDQAATLALVLVIDRSGSMSAVEGGASRMALAREGAIQAVETVKEGDQVGVIAFDSDARWVSDITTIRGPPDIRVVADRVATIREEGGTDIFRGMELAFRGLQQTQARVKHVIVLTDGEQGGPANFAGLTQQMRRAGITVSTLGIGSTGTAAATLQNIARLGQGRHYITTSARDVPRIMTQEARLAGRSFKQERDFRPRLTSSAPSVRGLVPADFPQLHGYVRVSAKPGSETVLSSDQEEPVLAQWQYGLGRALVWAADAEGEWARDWVGTEQFKRLWPQAVRWAMPAPVPAGLNVQVRPVGNQAYVRVEAAEATGEFRNHLSTAVDVSFPDGTARRVALPQTAPGRYEGRFPVATPGVYFMNVTQTNGAGQEVASQLTGYALPYLAEYRPSAPNRVLLERIAAETGGPVVTKPEEAWRKDTVRAYQPQDVWRYLTMAALLLFVVDVAVRRLRPSLYDLADARDAMARRTAGTRLPRIRFTMPRLHPVQGGRRR